MNEWWGWLVRLFGGWERTVGAYTSSATSGLRYATAALVGLAALTFTYFAAVQQAGVLPRLWARYTASLELRLRPMFILIPGKRVAYAQLLASYAILSIGLLFRLPYLLIAFLIALAVFSPSFVIDSMLQKRVRAVEAQLDNFLLTLANALKTTPSLGTALEATSQAIALPIKQDLELVLKEMRLGSTLDQGLLHMAARIKSRDVDAALSAILIGRQVGGNLPKILETSAASIREMTRLDGVIRTKTADARIQMWVLSTMPAGFFFGIQQLMPDFFAPLTANAMGYMVSGAAAVSWVTAILLARRVLAVDI